MHVEYEGKVLGAQLETVFREKNSGGQVWEDGRDIAREAEGCCWGAEGFMRNYGYTT